MMRVATATSLAFASLLVLSACADSSHGGTAADYVAVAEASDRLLADAREAIDESAIVREERVITDLETDRHRYSCSETTSRYVNSLQVWLTDIEAARNAVSLEALRLAESDWVEVSGDDRLSESRFFMGPAGFSLRMSVWTDRAGDSGVTFTVDSVCVPNPSDRPSTWGK